MNKNTICSLAFFMLIAGTGAFAQVLSGPPEYSVLDGNKVNLTNGKRSIRKEDLSIGSGVSSLKHAITTYNDYFVNFRDNYTGTIYNGGSSVSGSFTIASFNGMSTRFSRSGDTFTDSTDSGATLEKIDSNNYVYTHGDGTVVKYQAGLLDFGIRYNEMPPNGYPDKEVAWATEATYPNGVVVKIHRKSGSWDGNTYYRIQSVTNNLGMQLKYRYARNTTPEEMWPMQDWARPVEIIAINNAVEYCSPTADDCPLSNTWPSVKYSWPDGEIQDNDKFTITYPDGAEGVYVHKLFCTSVQTCGSKVPRITEVIESTSSGVATNSYEYKNTYSCTNDGQSWDCSTVRPNVIWKSNFGTAQWEYTYEIPSSRYVTVKNWSSGPDGYKAVWISPAGKPVRIEDESKDAVFELSSGQRVDKVTYGCCWFGGNAKNSVEFDYDSIGNIIERREIPEEGGGNPVYTSTAGFENNCGGSSVKTQHGAAWIKDAKGNQTEYTYHCASGNVATVTKPAGNNGIRPQVRYTYMQKYARYKDRSGQVVQADSPVWLLSSESYCRSRAASGSGCSQANDEVRTIYKYGSDASPNNLFLSEKAVVSNGETQRTCYNYDHYGNRVSETLPKSEMSSCSK